MTPTGLKKPMAKQGHFRFETIPSAQAALDEFFGNVKAAVGAGNMDTEESRNSYTIVMVA